MRALTAVWTVFAGIFIGLADFLRTVLGGVFGDFQWSPPVWLQPLIALARRCRDTVLVHRRVATGTAAAALLLIAAGLAWQQWPKPVPPAGVPQNVAWKLELPTPTCYECETAEQRAPKPLVLSFEAAIAPLTLVGKDLPAAQKMLSMEPAQPGVWHWRDDRTLAFTPSSDWPVGQAFEVSFAKRGFTLPEVTLAAQSFEFRSTPFKAWAQQSSFVQDPVNPALKTAEFQLRFSHPVDEASLKSRLKLEYFELPDDDKPASREAPAYTLALDAPRLLLTLRTAALPMQLLSGRIDLRLAAGVQSTLGGNASEAAVQAQIAIPGRGSLKVTRLGAGIARDTDDTPVQTLTLSLSQSATEAELRAKVQAWLLPLKHPDAKTQEAFEAEDGNENKPYVWIEATAVAALKQAQTLPLNYNALEVEHSEVHSFRHSAEPGRYLLVRVPAGLKSFGGYELAKRFDSVLQVPPFAKELRLTHSGALLAMSGQKKLTLFTRDLPGVRVELGRLLPEQLQHLVTQSGGRFDEFNWQNWSFNEDNLTERFSKDIPLPALPAGTAHYQPLDLAPYLANGAETRRGIFFLRLTGYDPTNGQLITQEPSSEDAECEGECIGADYGAKTDDTRLIVVTDLGLVVKRNKDGTQEVFVQSIANGEPVAGVRVQLIAKNGSAILSRDTDADGHASFPELSGYQREKEPVLYYAQKDGDQSFLPLANRYDTLDLSRFDVGGVSQSVQAGALSAYFFSDRGLYRPGEQARIGVIVKATAFAGALPQAQLQYEVTDPRGSVVLKTARALPASGFDELLFDSAANGASGGYTVSAYLPGARKNQRVLLGSLEFKVREFEPDRLKIVMALNAQRAQGWLRPEALSSAHVDLQNLFGTPAQARRVTAELRLTPWLPRFEGYEDYQFNDPQLAKEGVSVALSDAKTDAQGQADLAMDLKPYAATSYWLHLTAQGFEPDGGRGVTAEAGQVVSSLPYLIGWKADGDLYWIAKDSAKTVSLIAIDAEVKRTEAKALMLRRYERKWVSVLTRTPQGYYRYESRQKDSLLSEEKLGVPAAGHSLPLDTKTPGDFLYSVVDADERVFARVAYSVAGRGTVSRSLEKNAELKIALSKKDYLPGEEVEISLVAPYAGAGLITIEREKVLAYRWFKADSTASVQKIKIPEGLEGSAYIHVLYTRDPASEAVFTSPLSYGVAPFSVAIDARRAQLTLVAPAKIKPGETAQVTVTVNKPGKAIVFAVDEGILQVARYKTPDPLGFYFQKRSLDVRTLQILDLILPEFRALAATAAGGDADGALGKNLNPFKRKGDAPIAYWSGIVDVGPEAKTLSYVVPDRFNGTLRWMAVSVSPETIGVAESKTLVRGDFTLLPNAPLMATPGDEFEVSSGISNNLESAPKNAPVKVTLSVSPHLEVLGPAEQTVAISALSEGVARYRVRVKDSLGSAELVFTASYGGKSAKLRSTLSVRPASPYSPKLQMVLVPPGKSLDLAVQKSADFYPQFRSVEASVSTLPLVMAQGLTAYLGNYQHQCTEQLMSMAVPALVLSARPEFGTLKATQGATFSKLFNELALRQLPEDGYALWTGGGPGYEPASLYAQQFVIEASERGYSVPAGVSESGNRFLTKIARREGSSYFEDRNAAYAIYLLTRQGQLMSAEADALVQRLNHRDKGRWEADSTAAWLAAAYARMQQQDVAAKLINGVVSGNRSKARQYAYGYYTYYNDMVGDAELLYVLARHFPMQLVRYGPLLVESLMRGLNSGGTHSYAAGTTLLALDAYATVAEQAQGQFTLAEVGAGKGVKPLTLPAGRMPKVTLSPAATYLRVSNSGTLPTYAVLAELGFARTPPKVAEAKGIEVLREFTDDAGNTVTQVALGKEITVQLKVRALARDAVTGIALVDLLPGGFELVLPSTAAPESAVVEEAAPEEQSGEGEAPEPAAKRCNCDWVQQATGTLDFAEPREDRVVLYFDATRAVQSYSYRLKATTAGTFVVPPVYAEAMYDRSVYARSLGGGIEVTKP